MASPATTLSHEPTGPRPQPDPHADPHGDLHDGDDVLVHRVRGGDTEAFQELYRRHHATALAYGRRLCRDGADAHDVVAEAFTRVLVLLGRGRGPEGAFLPYLLRSLRNIAYDGARSGKRLVVTDRDAVFDRPVHDPDPAVAAHEQDAVRRAWRSLPTRWQEVLWLTHVEDIGVEAAAAQVGCSATALTSLTYRAREGLRRAYLQEHVPAPRTAACAAVSPRLGSYVRAPRLTGSLASVSWHLGACEACSEVVAELRRVDETMRDRSVLPAGPAGAQRARLAG